jgi:hypothetical protein
MVLTLEAANPINFQDCHHNLLIDCMMYIYPLKMLFQLGLDECVSSLLTHQPSKIAFIDWW